MVTQNALVADPIIKLHDGRNVGIATAGKSDGFPIFHFHGSPTSRLEVKLMASAAAAQGVRLIGLDRPGIGLSDNIEDYCILDWPDDVAEVADLLDIDRFAIQGMSAGGAYAMACAYKIPERITACGLISTVSPADVIMKEGPREMRLAYWMGWHLPRLLRLLLRFTMPDSHPDLASVKKQFIRNSTKLSDAEKRVFQDPGIGDDLAAAIAESYRNGGKGNREDAMRLVLPWGFKVEDIACDKIFLWHGERDNIMSPSSAHLLAKALPHCTATFYPGEGHVSVLVDHGQDILRSLCVR